MKDWHPLKDSTRIKVLHEAPDIWSLEITNALSSDGGLYACTMENMAGKVTMTARLVIEGKNCAAVNILEKFYKNFLILKKEITKDSLREVSPVIMLAHLCIQL